MEEILRMYYADNAKKLRLMVERILVKFGGVSDMDLDDFYSLANEVFADVIKRYNSSQPFEIFLYSCLLNKIKTEMTRRNRKRRKADRLAISLDTPVGEEEDSVLADMIADTFDLERIVAEKEGERSAEMEKYLNRLTDRQRKILELLADSYNSSEIQNMLHITKKEYADAMHGIHAYENISLLF